MVDTSRYQARIHPSRSVVVSKVALKDGHLLVIAGETRRVDARVGPSQLVEPYSGILKHLVANLEHLSLLWVQPLRLDGCHIEEGGVKVHRVPVEEVPA